jgi:valyl-tRNA synthetase
MVDIFSVILVGSLVTFLMYQNINKITQKIDDKTKDLHPRFARFASKIIDYIRTVKRDIDSDMECENPRFCKNEKCDEKRVIKELNELIRRAALYESTMAKGKKRKEIEADLVDILQKLESIINDSCLNGRVEAIKVKNELQNEYQKLLG